VNWFNVISQQFNTIYDSGVQDMLYWLGLIPDFKVPTHQSAMSQINIVLYPIRSHYNDTWLSSQDPILKWWTLSREV